MGSGQEVSMCQEDAENKISKECLRTTVDEAIKTKNICIIEGIEKENLRYAQKYTEVLVSEEELRVSIESYSKGFEGVILAIIAIGISWILFGVSRDPFLEVEFFFLGLVILSLGLWLWYRVRPYERKEFEKREKDIEFMHEIILKIEERLESVPGREGVS
jgi:hypothetical protein